MLMCSIRLKTVCNDGISSLVNNFENAELWAPQWSGLSDGAVVVVCCAVNHPLNPGWAHVCCEEPNSKRFSFMGHSVHAILPQVCLCSLKADTDGT